MTPEEFLESSKLPSDLIGKAASVVRVFCNKAASGNVKPIRALFYGEPGIGKSEACKTIAERLAPHKSYIRHVSAAGLTADIMRDWMSHIAYHNEDWSVFWVDEVDAVNPTVEVLLLEFLDKLPEKNAALFTSNEEMSDITERFQSRMKAIHFERPAWQLVAGFLSERWPELGDAAREIAETNDGDVRASLNDAQMHLDVEEYGDVK